jgi:hypothetical protein
MTPGVDPEFISDVSELQTDRALGAIAWKRG